MNIKGPVNITFAPLHGQSGEALVWSLTTAEAGRCNLLPCQSSPSGFPLGGFRSPSSASYFRGLTVGTSESVVPACPHKRLTSWLLWAIFAVSQVLPERPVNITKTRQGLPIKVTICQNSLLMPPGKKRKNTLACVFTVANVLGACQRYHRLLLIYR